MNMKKSEVSKLMAEMGRRGGKRRMTTITPERRSEIAKKAAAARWKGKKKPAVPKGE